MVEEMMHRGGKSKMGPLLQTVLQKGSLDWSVTEVFVPFILVEVKE